ncbi:enoyl-CoA hydratase/isomerase family protein [Ottowia sp. VDI28]|uniref:enoyl-CoA hydratase/isomerase family protein n=1 Tax=Ottowia sp. VDI28 TaxID=3133968 RepID=UPI003C2E802F
MMNPQGSVDYLARDGRAYVTLNRPEKRNAMSQHMWEQLMHAYDRAEDDDDVRVVVLSGAGDDFCAGHDLAEVGNQYGNGGTDENGHKRRPSQRARRQYDKTYSKARELLLLAEVWSAQEARENGLVNKVVPLGELHERGEEWAERIVRLPRDGIALGKAATNMAMQTLGVTSQFAYGPVLHTLATNMRWEPGEFNFMKERSVSGVRASTHQREAFYQTPRKQDS